MSATAIAPAARTDERAATQEPAFRYAAFISYASGTREGKGATFDRRVGERLQRLLETYRAPRRGRARRPARVGRVFRDRDELRATNDLSQMLREALADSRYLIVVCSPRARTSRWVNREVAEFARVRGVENVLLLLIEGEPDEAFPTALEELTPGVSPLDRYLAADVRAESPSASLRLLKREKLRLLAPLLGYGFDDLRQREHERRVRRLAATALAALALAVVLAGLSLALALARARAHASSDLALSTAARLMVMLVGESPGMRPIHVHQAREDADSLARLNPESLEAVTLQRTFVALEADGLRASDPSTSDSLYRRVRQLLVRQVVLRLRGFDPDARPASDSLVMPSANGQNPFRTNMTILEQSLRTVVWRSTAEDYADYMSQYVLQLNMADPANRAEVRRVLRVALTMFDRAGTLEGADRPAAVEIRRTLARLDG